MVLNLDYSTYQHVILENHVTILHFTYHICKRWIVITDSVSVTMNIWWDDSHRALGESLA